MADKPLFNLDAKGRWRLAYDSNQWVLQKRAGSPGRNRYGIHESGWRGVSFVGCRKATLGRLFREKGIVLTAEARARFDALPNQFLVFLADQQEYLALLDAKAVGTVVNLIESAPPDSGEARTAPSCPPNGLGHPPAVQRTSTSPSA